MHAVAHERLDLFARANADVFQAAGAFSDDDLFLRSSLDNDGAVDAREVFTNFFVPLGHYSGDVWNLVARRVQNFLAHDLGNEHPQRLRSEERRVGKEW